MVKSVRPSVPTRARVAAAGGGAGGDRRPPEGKHEKFVRLAEKRLGDILSRLNELSKLADREYYEPAEEEIAELFATLNRRIEIMQEEFQTGRKVGPFRFSRRTPPEK